MGTLPLRVTLIGKGQVGTALAVALGRQGVSVQSISFRKGLPDRFVHPDLVLVCVRDGQIPRVVSWLMRRRLDSRTVVAHVSGALSAEVLDPLRQCCRGVAQFHPFRSIRAEREVSFAGAFFVASGDRLAIAVLRRVARLLGSKLAVRPELVQSKYHLGAAVLANGGIALLHLSHHLLVESGIESKAALGMILDLQRSVLHNVELHGVEAALTGPVRRGDVETIRRHLATLRGTSRNALELYLALARAQVELVKSLGELDASTLARLKRTLRPPRRGFRS